MASARIHLSKLNKFLVEVLTGVRNKEAVVNELFFFADQFVAMLCWAICRQQVLKELEIFNKFSL